MVPNDKTFNYVLAILTLINYLVTVINIDQISSGVSTYSVYKKFTLNSRATCVYLRYKNQ